MTHIFLLIAAKCIATSGIFCTAMEMRPEISRPTWHTVSDCQRDQPGILTGLKAEGARVSMSLCIEEDDRKR